MVPAQLTRSHELLGITNLYQSVEDSSSKTRRENSPGDRVKQPTRFPTGHKQFSGVSLLIHRCHVDVDMEGNQVDARSTNN